MAGSGSRWWLWASGAAALGLGAAALVPIATAGLESRPRPAGGYDEALRRFDELQALDHPGVNPVCGSRLLAHGRPSERVAVLFHGITNCPRQFAAFGELLFARGWNVLIPRMPRNGLADRMTPELRGLRAAELRDYADTSVDIACGLGAEIALVGLSAGGVVAAWAAEQRPEVRRALVLAPSFGVGQMSPLRHMLTRNLASRLPSVRLTEPAERSARKPAHTYLVNYSRTMVEVLRFGLAVERAARRRPPAVRSLALVLNDADRVVDNALAWNLARRWKRWPGVRVDTHVFPAAAALPHDMIDPANAEQQTTRVYPVLLDLLGVAG